MYKYACSQGWDKKPGVRLVHGRWQDVIDEVSGQVPAGSTSLACCVLWGMANALRLVQGRWQEVVDEVSGNSRPGWMLGVQVEALAAPSTHLH